MGYQDHGQDYLSCLPPELLDMIISYLFPTHVPDKAFRSHHSVASSPELHPTALLASTSKHFRRECNAWCHHFLRQHARITNYRPFTPINAKRVRNYSGGKYGLLTWSTKHCVFCGKKSVRSAILANGLTCCMRCDKQEWPDKITKTEARKEYDLKVDHLFPQECNGARTLPAVRYGTYFSAGTPTTLFLRAEIEVLANAVHNGDFAAHNLARQKALQLRREKIESNKTAKLARQP